MRGSGADVFFAEATFAVPLTLSGLALLMLLPGIKVQNDPGDVTPIRQIQMARFDGKTWVLFGDILGDK